MDLITQGLLGATIAEAGWKKELGHKALWVGALAGMLPDLDALSELQGMWVSMLQHRGFTHSLFFAPLVAPILGYFLWKRSEKGTYFQWSHLLFWAIFTHPLLDIFTTYGTQFFFPASRMRISLDAVAIVDPFYSVPLFLVLWLAWRTKSDTIQTRKWAQIVLLVTTLYLGLGYVVSQVSIQRARKQLETSSLSKEVQIRAIPVFLTNLLWRIVAKDSQGNLWVGFHSFLHNHPIRFHKTKATQHRALAEIQKHPLIQRLNWFSDGYLQYSSRETPQGTLFKVEDLRYSALSRPIDSLWGAEILWTNGKIKSLESFRGKTRPNFSKEIKELWSFWTTGKSHLFGVSR